VRSARLTLLFAGALLAAAEVVSLSLLLRELGERQADRVRNAVEQAAAHLPKIAEWARGQSSIPAATIDLPIDPFDRLSLDDAGSPEVTPDMRRKLEAGELVVISRASDRDLSVLGLVHTSSGPRIFRLIDAGSAVSRFAVDRTLIAQHALVLLAALVGFALVGLAREAPPSESAPAVRAYEEAMSRLRIRDDERRAAFETERNALNTVLRDREAMARAGELTAGIVHEVRNSIGAIAVQAKFAESAEDERVRSAALAIAEEVRTLQNVMTRFLDFIRNEEVRFAEFDLGRTVSRVAAREKSNHPAEVSVEGADTRVTGDEDLLERALENVVRNACQAAGPSGHVSVKFGADATHAFVIVDDDGPGIEDAEKALRPFKSDRPGGLGLGLPLALKILSLHHGSLDIGSRSEGGTQMLCRWPKIAP
jgi:signal transduction histidine kinase